MPLTLDECRTVMAATLAHARGKGWKVAVAVVDEGGLLQALERMEGAFPLSSQIAEAKACGTAVWHKEGEALAQLQSERPAFYAQVDRQVRLPMMPGQGAALIRRGGQILGAVGVSGALSHEDFECAKAGLAALPAE